MNMHYAPEKETENGSAAAFCMATTENSTTMERRPKPIKSPKERVGRNTPLRQVEKNKKRISGNGNLSPEYCGGNLPSAHNEDKA